MSKVRVLLVDDRPENLMSLEATLLNPDYELVKVPSGEDALRYLLTNDCAIILLDVQMPGMDGYETADLIKKDPKLKDIPIIFLTALNTDAGYVARGYRVGAVDYMSKPLVPEFLRAKVAVFAQLHRAKEKIIEQQAQLREHEAQAQRRRLAELELVSLRREQALHRRYRELVEGIQHAVVWVAEPSSLVMSFASPSFTATTGKVLDLNRADQLRHLVHPDDWPTFELRLRDLRPDLPETIVHRLLRRDGEVLWLSTTVRLEKKIERGANGGGHDEGDEIRGFSVDVTEAKLVERTLSLLARISEEANRSLDASDIVQHVAVACVPDVADGCCVIVESGAGDALPGVSTSTWSTPQQAALAEKLEALPLDASSPFYPTNAPILVRDVPQHLGGDDDLRGNVLRELGAHSFLAVPLVVGERRLGTLSMWSCTPSRPMNEHAMLLVGEIGRRTVQALENARLYHGQTEAVAYRDEFLSVASHELRTPLSPLKLGLQSSLSSLTKAPDKPPTPTVIKSLQVADRQVDRLQLLVDTLLDVSRIRAGRLELDRGRVDLDGLVREVLARFQVELDRKDLKVTQRLAPVAGRWDRSRLDQVITNLITNAIKYGNGKPFEIEVERDESRARLVVIDQGIGIAAGDTERIFNRFERAVTSKNFTGLGLGLYITRQIVRAHGGDIKVESEPGGGSRFCVDLPVEGDAASIMH